MDRTTLKIDNYDGTNKLCVYETPCGWCSKWDKKCDKKTPERGQRAKCNPIDDARSTVSWEEILG